MATEKKVDAQKVVTGEVRLSHVRVFEPDENGSYKCMIMIPKTDTVTLGKIKAAEDAAAVSGLNTKFGGKMPKNYSILKDGDEDADEYPEQAGHMFMWISSRTRKPGVVGRDLQPVEDQSEVYSGCYARVSMRAFPYNNESKGVSFGLNHIQKTRDGEPLGGITRAEDDFEALPDAGDADGADLL